GRQEAEILERGVEARLPRGGIGLDRGEVAGDAAPAVLDRAVKRLAVGGAQAVFHVPDLFGDGGGEAVHPGVLWSVCGDTLMHRPGPRGKRPRVSAGVRGVRGIFTRGESLAFL